MSSEREIHQQAGLSELKNVLADIIRRNRLRLALLMLAGAGSASFGVGVADVEKIGNQEENYRREANLVIPPAADQELELAKVSIDYLFAGGDVDLEHIYEIFGRDDASKRLADVWVEENSSDFRYNRDLLLAFGGVVVATVEVAGSITTLFNVSSSRPR